MNIEENTLVEKVANAVIFKICLMLLIAAGTFGLFLMVTNMMRTIYEKGYAAASQELVTPENSDETGCNIHINIPMTEANLIKGFQGVCPDQDASLQ